MTSQKGFAPIIIIIIVVAMLGIGAGGYVLVSKRKAVPPVTPGMAPETSTETPSESKKNQDATKNWQVYESKKRTFWAIWWQICARNAYPSFRGAGKSI